MADETQIQETLNEVSSDSAANVASEDLALAQLKDPDLSSEQIEEFSQHAGLMKSRKVRMAVACHQKTPRRIALRTIRELYTFELMRFAVRPTASADLKRLADELLLSRLTSIALGERISLARRSSTLVAGALLLDTESSVWKASLENPRLTEAAIVRALQRANATGALVEAVSHHAKWSVRIEVQVALLRNAHTPLAKAIEFARRIPPQQLRDILHVSRIPEKVKSYLRTESEVGGS
jgi:hypothetical protein